MGALSTEATRSIAARAATQEKSHPERDEIELSAVLHALSDPMRLRIVAAVADGGERSCKSIHLPVVKSTCTHHFRVLREAGLIRQRCAGTTRLNSLRREDLEYRFPGLVEAVLRAAGWVPAVPAMPVLARAPETPVLARGPEVPAVAVLARSAAVPAVPELARGAEAPAGPVLARGAKVSAAPVLARGAEAGSCLTVSLWPATEL